VALLEVRELSRSFGGLRAVNAVSFDVAEGSITAVIGPNGAGKTTLFNCICGSLASDSGAVRFDGRSIMGLPPHRVAAAGIARTFQTVRISAHMSVLDNVMLGRHLRSSAGMLAGMLALRRSSREQEQQRATAMGLLERLGIVALADVPAGGLAFGQQRAVEFARALAVEPRLLLLDEPAAGLNMHESAELADLIRATRDRGITILLVEHDMSLVMGISEHIVVLSNGQRIAHGPPREIQRNPEVVRVYLGDEHA
jgi:ABC-type branched-subunit amino acid transport system ATPase component